MENHPRLILFFGVLMVTSSSFIIRFASEDPYLLATSRVLLTGLLSLILAHFKGYHKLELDRRQVTLILLSGVSLASHFAWWFASLDHLTIGISLSLTNTAPVWLLIISSAIYKSMPNRREMISVLLVIMGSVLLFSSENLTNLEFKGLVLALGSAIGFAIYLLVAKQLVDEIGLYRYFAYVNIVAGFTLLIYLGSVSELQYLSSPSLWSFGLILAMIPGILGHANYNYAMAKLPQFDVALATLGEPVLGTIIAYLVFQETFSIIEGLALLLLLAAISLSVIKVGVRSKSSLI